MKKLLDLVNDERKITAIKPAKACYSDTADCCPNSYDSCTYVDRTACMSYNTSDICDYDYESCDGIIGRYDGNDICTKDMP